MTDDKGVIETRCYTNAYLELWQELEAEFPQRFSVCDTHWLANPIQIFAIHYLRTRGGEADLRYFQDISNQILVNTMRYAAPLIMPGYKFDRTERNETVKQELYEVAERYFEEIENFIRDNYSQELYIQISQWAVKPIGDIVDLATLEKWGAERLTDRLEEITDGLIKALPNIFRLELFGKGL